jgi:hypothetical protein
MQSRTTRTNEPKRYLEGLPQDKAGLESLKASLELDVNKIEDQLKKFSQEAYATQEEADSWERKAITARRIKLEQLTEINTRLARLANPVERKNKAIELIGRLEAELKVADPDNPLLDEVTDFYYELRA